VHYPRDVFGGAVLGSIWGILTILVAPAWLPGNFDVHIPQVAETNTPLTLDVAEECLLYDESMTRISKGEMPERLVERLRAVVASIHTA